MPEVLTERENAVISLVSQATGGMLLETRLVDVHKLEGGETATLRFNLNEGPSTDLERARIESGGETPEQLASVVIAELKRQLPAG
jgi:hypothetical protein